MKLVVRQSTHGRGVFTEEPIAANTLIIRFSGPLLRYADTTPTTFALQVGPDTYIGASGGPDDFINHSCEPNAGFRIQGITADLYAIRDTAAGEEILFDYSTTLDEDDFTIVCQCGTPSCRGIIGDGKYLPPDVWQRYLDLGILPDYVRRRRAWTAGRNHGEDLADRRDQFRPRQMDGLLRMAREHPADGAGSLLDYLGYGATLAT